MTPLYIHSLIRCGSNAVEELLNANSDIQTFGRKTHPWCWKHGEYREGHGHRHILICTRNIFEWLSSSFRLYKMHGNGCTKATNVNDFVLMKIRQKNGIFDNPVQLYNKMNNQWLDCDNGGFKKAVVRNEDFILDQKAVLDRLAGIFGFQTHETFTPITHEAGIYTRHGGQFRRGKEIMKRKVMNQFTPESIEFINSQIDSELIKKLDYISFHHGQNVQTAL